MSKFYFFVVLPFFRLAPDGVPDTVGKVLADLVSKSRDAALELDPVLIVKINMLAH
jgi:hypothetical protein